MSKEKSEEIEEEVDFSGIKNFFRKLNNANEEEVIKLKSYIQEKREQGSSDKQITKILVKKGLDNDVIERLFSEKEEFSALNLYGKFYAFAGIIILIATAILTIGSFSEEMFGYGLLSLVIGGTISVFCFAVNSFIKLMMSIEEHLRMSKEYLRKLVKK